MRLGKREENERKQSKEVREGGRRRKEREKEKRRNTARESVVSLMLGTPLTATLEFLLCVFEHFE